jgi:methionine biosynthesis protein MetW
MKYEPLYQQVLRWVPERARVLDLGSGDGEFLAQLVKARRATGEGVEQNPEWVARCIERGLVVHQSDIMDGLDQYGDGAFDFVLLLGSFQEMKPTEQLVREALRVGRKLVISFSNFAYAGARWQMLFGGRAPVTQALPAPWYRTSNLHFFSILDFREFCREMRIRETERAYFNAHGPVRWWPNLRAEVALSLLEWQRPVGG